VFRLHNARPGWHEKVRMVKQVEHLSLNLDGLALGNMESSGPPEVDFINARTLKRVVPIPVPTVQSERRGREHLETTPPTK
jgi:hypothetical protein